MLICRWEQLAEDLKKQEGGRAFRAGQEEWMEMGMGMGLGMGAG